MSNTPSSSILISNQSQYVQTSVYKPYYGDDLGVNVTGETTRFRVWAPNAEGVEVNIYDSPTLPDIYLSLSMNRSVDGTWIASVAKNLTGKYYTFRICFHGEWLDETPGILAKATGCNGLRAAIVDLTETNPPGWEADKGPELKSPVDAVIYEMHHRDMTAHSSSGVVNKGKFLAMTESGSVSPDGEPTGIGHISQLGITHVQLLPSFDFISVDETSPASLQYNWGYDPENFNVPEGSYATDTSDPKVRIREMKEMIMAFHSRGIGVVMDVVYNHTADALTSAFSLTAPGYYYRYKRDGSFSDASGCGNETASEREQMRLFMIKSVIYWAKEYHIDGFRFDLMGIHDIKTMNEIASELRKLNPGILIYGEGWTAGPAAIPAEERAVKDNVGKLNRIGVFSDDIRDAIKGSAFDSSDKGFVAGRAGLEESIKAGIVASTSHPQVDFRMNRKTSWPYSPSPEVIINYVSCHDNLTLTDKLAASMPGSIKAQRCRAARLAQTIIFTSQGIPFIFAGEEIFRDKKGIANSYKEPDAVNAIDWRLKSANKAQFEYYRNLIALRRKHPAFRLRTAEEIARHIVFEPEQRPSLVSYSIQHHAGGDDWEEIRLIFNGGDKAARVNVPHAGWIVVAEDGNINPDGLRKSRGGRLTVAAVSALILARKR